VPPRSFTAVTKQDTAFDMSGLMTVRFCRHVTPWRFGGRWCFHLQGSCTRTLDSNHLSKRRPLFTKCNDDTSLTTWILINRAARNSNVVTELLFVFVGPSVLLPLFNDALLVCNWVSCEWCARRGRGLVSDNVTTKNRDDPKDLHVHTTLTFRNVTNTGPAKCHGTAQAATRSRVSPCGIYGGQSGTGQLSSPSTPVSHSLYHSTNTPYSYIILAVGTVGACGSAVG
jgi:hypothetical protein